MVVEVSAPHMSQVQESPLQYGDSRKGTLFCSLYIHIPITCGFIVENRSLLQDAKLQLKKSKRKDYYKILSLPKDCSDADIKKAYRREALKHHPGYQHYIFTLSVLIIIPVQKLRQRSYIKGEKLLHQYSTA